MSAMQPHPQSPATQNEEQPFDAAAFLDEPDSYAANRRDGWTGARQKGFLEILADTGEAEFAAQAVGMTIQSAYALRRRPGGHGFACGWAVALRHAGQRLIDTAYSRALQTREEPIVVDGEVVGTRLKQNDRMLIYVINRIDKINRGDVIDMPAAPQPQADVERIADGRHIEANNQAYLRCIERDGDAMWEEERAKEAEIDAQFEADCAIRRGNACPVPKTEKETEAETENAGDEADLSVQEPDTHAARFMADARVASGTHTSAPHPYDGFGGDMLESDMPPCDMPDMIEDCGVRNDIAPEDVDISDLDTDVAAQWTDDQWERAYNSGLLDRMDDAWWDETQRQAEAIMAAENDSKNGAADEDEVGNMDSPKVD